MLSEKMSILHFLKSKTYCTGFCTYSFKAGNRLRNAFNQVAISPQEIFKTILTFFCKREVSANTSQSNRHSSGLPSGGTRGASERG